MDLTTSALQLAWSSVGRWRTPISTVLNEDSKQETRSKTLCSLCDHGLPSVIYDDPTGAGEVLKSKAGRAGAVLRRRNVDQIDCAGHDELHLACWLQTSTAEVIVDGATFYGATCSQITTNNNQRLRTGYQKWLVSITAAVAALLKKSDARNSVLRHFGSRPPTTPPWRLTRTSRLTRSATTNFSIGTHERLCRLEYITADPEQPSEPCYDHGRPL